MKVLLSLIYYCLSQHTEELVRQKQLITNCTRFPDHLEQVEFSVQIWYLCLKMITGCMYKKKIEFPLGADIFGGLHWDGHICWSDNHVYVKFAWGWTAQHLFHFRKMTQLLPGWIWMAFTAWLSELLSLLSCEWKPAPTHPWLIIVPVF